MRLAIYGGGGFGRVVADMIGRIGGHTLVGFLDDAPAVVAAGAALPGGAVLAQGALLDEQPPDGRG